MGILIEPVGESSFKWGGVSSLLTGGPVNTGYFEPLPLPSTIYGFLKYAYTMKGISDIEPKFKGPAFYARYDDMEAFCVHIYPQALGCNFGDGSLHYLKIEEDAEAYTYITGIALDRKRKTAKEHYIYVTKMLSYEKLARAIHRFAKGEEKSAEIYGVYLEGIDEDVSQKLQNFVGPFGSESRVAKVKNADFNVKKIGLKLLISPAFVDNNAFEDSRDSKSVKWERKEVNISTISKLIDKKNEPVALKITYKMLSLGFDRNRRLKMSLAVMPSLEILSDINGNIGYYGQKGWGSVMEI